MASKKKKKSKKVGEPVVTMTVEVREKQISVVTTYKGRSVPYVMNKAERGWKGAAKVTETTRLFEEAFADHPTAEIEDIVNSLSSLGMDLHEEMLLGEEY